MNKKRSACGLAIMVAVMPITTTAHAGLRLEQCEAQALAQHPSVRLAAEESELSRLKRQEAQRAIGPLMTLKGERTEGKSVEELGTPDFTEEAYGVQVSQPIFQGGRLYQVYRQAKATHMAMQAKEQKARQEVMYGVREATWNLAKAQRALEIYQRSAADLQLEETAAQRLVDRDTITRQTYMTIKGQSVQAAYSLASAQAEVEARLWQWTAALGLKSPPPERPDVSLAVSSDNLVIPTLEDCLRLASLEHPDVKVQAYTAEAAMHGDRAGKALYYPKLSLSGFYGRSGGAFRGETLRLREDWNAGVQLSQYFAWSTLSASGFAQDTSPKIGQSTRTQSRTASASVGVLDGLKTRTERMDAAVAYHQAQIQSDRTTMEIANNVREAYAAYRKALAQLKIAENGLPLAQSEYAIAKIRSSHREVPLSERATSRNRLAQAETSLLDAQSATHIALAALTRAMGRDALPTENPHAQAH